MLLSCVVPRFAQDQGGEDEGGARAVDEDVDVDVDVDMDMDVDVDEM